MFPSTSSRETLRFSGNKIRLRLGKHYIAFNSLEPVDMASSAVRIGNEIVSPASRSARTIGVIFDEP